MTPLYKALSLLALLLVCACGSVNAFVPAVNRPATALLGAKERNAVSRMSATTRSKDPVDDATEPPVMIRFNAIPAVAFLGIVALAVSRPDTTELDTAMFQQILDNPTNPGINELFLTLFNVFLPLPAILAALIFPQGSRSEGTVPAGPFVACSFALGYFALGPYLSLRAAPRVALDRVDVSWGTQNILEQKAVAWGLLGLLVYLPFAVHVPQAYAVDGGVTLYQGLVDLLSTSRLAFVSCVDLTLLHLTAAALIPADYALRTKDSANGVALAVAAATVPFVGPALYVALRPKLLVLQDK